MESVSGIVLELYDRERVSLSRYLMLLGVDADACRDIVHDTFVRLHEHLLSKGDRSNLRAWLYKVGHNLAANRRSSAHCARTEPLPDINRLAVSAPGATPEEALLNRERELKLSEAVSALSASQRECLVLRAQGFKYREIAEILHLSTSTVAEHVQKGIESLRSSV